MYLTELKIKNLKLLRDFRLTLGTSEKPRMWTVLLGENCLCKTSILRAIAIAASGYVRGNQLADVPSLPDRRSPEATLEIEAELTFGSLRHGEREYPLLAASSLAKPPALRSALTIEPGHKTLKGWSEYLAMPSDLTVRIDPIEQASSRSLPFWFVAGYGTSRLLPRPGSSEKSEDPVLSRLNSLFDRGRLIGTGFAELLPDTTVYAQTLQRALIASELLPLATELELHVRHNVRMAQDLVEGHRFSLRHGGTAVETPATWLSQGYQSTIAWVADLIGQQFWEATKKPALEEMEGLVLIDEIDLHLHPKWQIALIPTLKKIFPRLQFVVTTHSPMVLPGLAREEVVLLRQDEEGNVIAEEAPEAPALLTGSEIYRQFFGVENLYPAELGRDLRRYSFLVGTPVRNPAEDDEMQALRQRLAAAGVDPGWEPTSES